MRAIQYAFGILGSFARPRAEHIPPARALAQSIARLTAPARFV